MHIQDRNRDSAASDSPDAFLRAVEEWHLSCCRAWLRHRGCVDRYGAVIDALITWLAEHPGPAMLYFSDGGRCPQPELLPHALAARRRMTSFIVENMPSRQSADHEVKLEFIVGLVRQLVREELRKESTDHARLAHNLTHLVPLFVAHSCAAH